MVARTKSPQQSSSERWRRWTSAARWLATLMRNSRWMPLKRDAQTRADPQQGHRSPVQRLGQVCELEQVPQRRRQRGNAPPGFYIEVIKLLMEERQVKGVFVDTLSLNYGTSTDFAVHYKWLPAGRWGIQCLTHLGRLPRTRAIAAVGGRRSPASPAGRCGGLGWRKLCCASVTRGGMSRSPRTVWCCAVNLFVVMTRCA